MANGEQEALWNDVVGRTWVQNVDQFDATLEPFGRAVMAKLDLRPGERVIDVGTGVGSTTIDLARRVDPGTVCGVDLSKVMVSEARRRLAASDVANADFLQADVQTAELGTDRFDVAFSRVGVMFFADPVAAFSNLASSMVPGGRLGFVCFQAPAANPFIVIPVLATASALGEPTLPAPDAPGPFSLADPTRTRLILERAGFVAVSIDAGPDEAVLHGAEDLFGLAERVLQQNPAIAMRMAEVDQSTRNAAIRDAAAALEPYRDGGVVRLEAGTWIVTARLPD